MPESCFDLSKLLLYRNLLQDDLITRLQSLEKAEDQYELASRLIVWAEKAGITGSIAENYVLYQIGCDENVYSSTNEKNGGQPGHSLLRAAIHDIAILKTLLNSGLSQRFCDELKPMLLDYQPARGPKSNSAGRFYNLEVLRDLFFDVTQKHTPEEIALALGRYYDHYGCGNLTGYAAFTWDAGRRQISGIEHSDPVQLQDIIGYEYQKAELVRNTEAFIQGKPANNVLLVGARGTGKSSSVKAIVNAYYDQGLRLMEIAKTDFKHIPEIMAALREYGKKFILFMDDLSFEEFEAEYKILKSLIDGGMAVCPDNVLIYATSNRRNLIKETWEERSGNELHRQDTLNEKVSLADRFGITLFYTLPNQEEYFHIIADIARKSNISLSPAELKEAALRWEMSHSGRSGRSAKQLVDYLAGKMAN
ncbi:ATP-binding protein [Sporomusa acidovorans]|uniref:Replication factor C large subunit n=1 Tax=Sporomusa acidovorans (strain ATCC 49682 / DSM 3132 / Mol) TaxID=1123286 RepID=A0ABZ3J163_SPOA4|nr:ATP-binding protein [Sporomusa acidovorans]OZC22850.1 replication factor C large subunit [Sporomusa acidovorans DSM 3132]SDE52945.1 hypothetical protein SAMN04488499_101597 [Sporomusa acidovorans]